MVMRRERKRVIKGDVHVILSCHVHELLFATFANIGGSEPLFTRYWMNLLIFLRAFVAAEIAKVINPTDCGSSPGHQRDSGRDNADAAARPASVRYTVEESNRLSCETRINLASTAWLNVSVESVSSQK